MKERPLIMHPHEVQATLDGRQTQFRRVIKPQPYGGYDPSLNKDGLWEWCADLDPEDAPGTGPRKCPYGVPGDRLWVRERIDNRPEHSNFYYAADSKGVGEAIFDGLIGYGWRQKKVIPSIHMPRWASRITLEVVNVRAERLQDIDYIDAFAEGCMTHPGSRDKQQSMEEEVLEEFEAMWNSINGKKYPWSDNPWVWVADFKRINS